jgi:ABC-type uncharacterized transport system permease subunit
VQILDTALLVSAVTIIAPILLATVGELVSERAGVMNVGLEGVLLTGAFTGYLTESLTHHISAGFLGGMLGGLAFGVLMAVLAVEAKVDQIVAGIALNLLGLGLTTFLDQRIFVTPEVFDPLPRLAVPGLAELPVIGPGLFRQDAFVYVTALVVVAVGVSVNRTTWGIGLRATGESPVSADAAGVSVRAMRWSATLFSALCCGAAGAYISIGDVGVFRSDMTGGRGYLALAAVLFGGWRLRGALVAVAIFGVADAVELRLQSSGGVPREIWIAALVIVVVLGAGRGRPRPALIGCAVVFAVLAVTSPHLSIPVPLWLALPYALALVALVGDGRHRHHPPAALAVPYRRSEA